MPVGTGSLEPTERSPELGASSAVPDFRSSMAVTTAVSNTTTEGNFSARSNRTSSRLGFSMRSTERKTPVKKTATG